MPHPPTRGWTPMDACIRRALGPTQTDALDWKLDGSVKDCCARVVVKRRGENTSQFFPLMKSLSTRSANCKPGVNLNMYERERNSARYAEAAAATIAIELTM